MTAEPLPEEPRVDKSWVLTKDDLRWLLEVIQGDTGWCSLDLETTGLDEHAVQGGTSNGGVAARIVLASLTFQRGDTWLVPLSHPESPWSGKWRQVARLLFQKIKRSARPLVLHHGKFDLRWVLATTGVDLSQQMMWDTNVSSHLLDENASTKLKERAPSTFAISRWDDDVDLTYPGAAEDVPLIELGEYAARDTYWTNRLREHHQWLLNLLDASEPQDAEERELSNLGRLATWVSMPTSRTLAAVEQRGIVLDVDWCRTSLREHTEASEALFQSLVGRYALTGTPSFAPTSHYFRDWAEAAVEAGDLRVTDLTPTGKPAWGAAVLQRQANAGSELAQELLDFRGLDKRAQYLRSWLGVVSPSGRIHATYNDAVVVTGRLSSNSPNMQQVTKSLRPAFVPSEGCYLVELDYSQIELRVAAFISRSLPMLEAFREGQDLHTLLASQITGKRLEEVHPHERQAGKSANFGLLYGMSVDGFRNYADLVYGVSLTVDEAALVHQTFFDTWDGLRSWHERTIRQVNRTGQVISPIGRVRRLPGVWGHDPGLAERAAINAPVQGFASDLMQIAAASIEGTLPGSVPVAGAALVGTVHDSILVEVRQEDWESIVAECQQRMTEEVVAVLRKRLYCDLDVPLVADVTVSTRWGLGDVNSP